MDWDIYRSAIWGRLWERERERELKIERVNTVVDVSNWRKGESDHVKEMEDDGWRQGGRIYFHGHVFIETELYLGVDLNRGSCVEEAATVMAPESKTLQKTTKHKTLHPSSSSHHWAGPSPGPVKVVLFVFPPHWIAWRQSYHNTSADRISK